MKIEDVDDFLSEARQQYETGRKVDDVDREAAEDDNKFAYADDKNLDQWDKRAKKARGNKRPILQWNRIPTYTQRIANDSRKNKPSIKISRGDEESTKETAEYIAARIRHIEYESNVDTARETVAKQQVVTGRGFLRVSTEWIPGTDKQRIVVDAIPNQFSVVWIGGFKYDKSDADACFVIRLITKAEHTRKYGKEATEKALDFASENTLNGWIGVGEDGEMIQVADYWFKKYKSVTVGKRTEKVGEVYSCVIDGAQILKDVEPWIGSTIPILPCWGEQAVVDGVQRTFSLVRNAKTPQRDLNLAISTLAELVGQQPKSPFLAAIESIAENHMDDWKNAHNTPLAVLFWKRWDEAGRELPKPERITSEPPIQACLEWVATCIDGIKSSMGIFDAAIGAKSNEQSGVAIERRKVQGEITNLHFPDNQARTNKYLGEILVELIMKMEREGSYPVRSEDGKTHIVPMGVEHPDWKTGEPVTHDLSSGQYGVYVSQQASFDTQRQELKERDQELIAAAPELIWIFGDQMFANDDAPGSEERADRMKRAIQMKTPGLVQEKGNKPDPQALQQQLQQATQELQTVQAFAQDLHQKLEGKVLEMQQEAEMERMKLEFQYAKLRVDDENKKLEIASREGIAELTQQIAVLESRMDRAQEMATLEANQAHAMETQDGQQQHESSEAEAQRMAAADSQQQAQDHAAQQADIDRQAAAEAQETE